MLCAGDIGLGRVLQNFSAVTFAGVSSKNQALGMVSVSKNYSG